MSAITGRRARTFAEFRERLGTMIDDEGVARGLAFQPRPSDVVISPFAKCGTTWLQQIVHGLRTRGDMDFDDISRVVPWIETADALGLDLDAEQRAEPRAYKSHLAYPPIPKGARYIVSLRDPKDALVSMYRFMEGWFLEPGTVSIDEFARGHFLHRGEGRDYWFHLLSWWERRHASDLLLLTFEDMKADLPGTVRRVAEFIGVPLDAELLDLVVRQSTIEFMTAHKDRFDDFLMRTLSERKFHLPPGSDSAKVRKGEVGEHRTELSAEIGAALDEVWAAEIEPRTGLRDYAELRAALAAGR